MFQHVVAHTIDGLKPFTDPTLAEWVWKRMRASFPDAVAAVLMPDYPHLIVEGRPNVVRELGALLSGISRHARQRRLWQPIPEPREIPDFRHLQRQIRYVLLNPCRARLAADPLEWPWSTHRGVIGAEIDPWVSAERLVPIFG